MRNNRAPDFANRIEDHVVQINDAEPDSDELQTSFYWNSDPDFLTIENDSLFLHDKPLGTHHRADHKQFGDGFTTGQTDCAARYRVETRWRTRCTIANKETLGRNVLSSSSVVNQH